MSSCPPSPPPLQNTVVRKFVSDSGRMYTTFSINLGLLILGGLYYLYNAKSSVPFQYYPSGVRGSANTASPLHTRPS